MEPEAEMEHFLNRGTSSGSFYFKTTEEIAQDGRKGNGSDSGE